MEVKSLPVRKLQGGGRGRVQGEEGGDAVATVCGRRADTGSHPTLFKESLCPKHIVV